MMSPVPAETVPEFRCRDGSEIVIGTADVERKPIHDPRYGGYAVAGSACAGGDGGHRGLRSGNRQATADRVGGSQGTTTTGRWLWCKVCIATLRALAEHGHGRWRPRDAGLPAAARLFGHRPISRRDAGLRTTRRLPRSPTPAVGIDPGDRRLNVGQPILRRSAHNAMAWFRADCETPSLRRSSHATSTGILSNVSSSNRMPESRDSRLPDPSAARSSRRSTSLSGPALPCAIDPNNRGLLAP